MKTETKPKPKRPKSPDAPESRAPALAVEAWPVDRPKPYAKNPRRNDAAVEKVAASIREFGWAQPIVVDGDGVIIIGHTRLKAAKKLGLKTVPVLVRADLSPEQVAALRLADNKTAEIAEWDEPMLAEELDALVGKIDMEQFGFGEELDALADGLDADKYTDKVDAVHYEPTTEEAPPVEALFDETETRKRVDAANAADIPDEVRAFLVAAAHRHTRFRYDRIAEYYSHATPEVQRLMEDSALVIVDFDDAIKNGWTALKDGLKAEAADEA